MQLFPYQVEGAKFLATVGRGLLADEMGLGKSAQAITACDILDAQRVLVICPASLVENWRREFLRFQSISRYVAEPHRVTGGKGPIVNVTSYNRAGRDTDFLSLVEYDVLILDEAHYLKSHKAKRTQAVFGPKCDGVGGLVSRAANVFCLTGTPTPNNPSELWPMLRAVMPGALARDVVIAPKGSVDRGGLIELPPGADPSSVQRIPGKPYAYWPFVERFCYTRDTGFGITIVKGKNLPELKARIAPFMLRRKKDDVLKDLPPIRFDTLALEGKFPKEATEEAKLVAETLERDGIKGLKALGPHVAQLRRLTGLAKVPAAIEWIEEQLESGLEKLVVFAHHRDVIASISEVMGNSAVTVSGSTMSEDRQRCVDFFQKDPNIKVFIGQIQAAGVGLTLTAASDVLFVESSWVPAENEQAAMRVHRIGQRNSCLIRFAMLAGSIDEQIQKAVLRKAADISRLFS